MLTSKTLDTLSVDELERLRAKGARYLLVCKHSIGQWEAGDVLSWHKTSDSACRADAKADPSRGFMHVVDIYNALADAAHRAS